MTNLLTLVSMVVVAATLGYAHGRWRTLSSIIIYLPLAVGILSAGAMLLFAHGPIACSAVATGCACAGLGVHVMGSFIVEGFKRSGLVVTLMKKKIVDAEFSDDNGET